MRPEERKNVPSRDQLYGLFSDQPRVSQLLSQAERLLRQVVEGSARHEIVKGFLQQTHPLSEALVKPYPILSDRSPMAAMRAILEDEKRIEGQSRGSGIEKPRPVLPDERDDKIPSEQRVEAENPFGRLGFLATVEDLTSLWPQSRVVHLGSQTVVNVRTIEQLLALCPDLEIIQIPPSYLSRVGPGIRSLLEERSIQIQAGRTRELRDYDQARVDDDYLLKKKAFDEMLGDPTKSTLFRKMQEFEFEEFDIAMMYFGNERVSIREIAQRLGCKEVHLYRTFRSFMHWVGVPYGERAVQRKAANLPRRLNRLDQARTNIESINQFREGFKVDESLPPITLPIARWEMWQKITLLNRSNPEIFEALRMQQPRGFEALIHYFELEQLGGSRRTLQDIGNDLDHITRERVRQLRNQALDFLGLLDED